MGLHIASSIADESPVYLLSDRIEGVEPNRTAALNLSRRDLDVKLRVHLVPAPAVDMDTLHAHLVPTPAYIISV